MYDPIRKEPHQLETNADLTGFNFTRAKTDKISHMIPSYIDWMGFIREAGYGRLLESPVIDVNSAEYQKVDALKTIRVKKVRPLKPGKPGSVKHEEEHGEAKEHHGVDVEKSEQPVPKSSAATPALASNEPFDFDFDTSG